MKYLTIPLLFLPSAALAHDGDAAGSFAAGLGHPFGGADHLLAMVTLGLLAAQTGGRAIWILPLSFVAAMLVGGVAGASGLGDPGVEPVILASVMVLGAVVALALWMPLAVMVPMAALFGTAHGWAHGAEGPATGLATYAAGFVVATALLHAAGIALGRGVPALALQAAGLVAALSGLSLAMSV